MITPAKRYRHNRSLLAFLGTIGFFLFAVQVNYQYSSIEDPSADVKDPVSIIVRSVAVTRGTEGELLPVREEKRLPVTDVFSGDHSISRLASQPLITPDGTPLSLRGPPCMGVCV